MRALLLVIAAAGLLLTDSSPASAQRGSTPARQVCRTAPLGNVDSFINNTFEASFVSTGSAPVELTIQLCDLTGACFISGFACANVPLTIGQGCSTGNLVANNPLYAKFTLKPTGGGTVGGEGSLRVTAPDGGNSAAIQTTCSGPAIERVPATEN
jgi:hypothetical protein